MHMKKIVSLLLTVLLLISCMPALADMLPNLPMDKVSVGPAPKNDNYLSSTEYVDDSISVKIYKDRYADTDYMYAHVKITHPSQLRTAPASVGTSSKVTFKSSSTRRGRDIAEDANAVIAMNGDYYTKSECTVVFRMGTQYRNKADGLRDLLIIDKNGDFSYLTAPRKDDYVAYYEAHKEEMYQVFCFGPVLVENGVSVITEDYLNKYIGSQNNAQRAAICQLGPLEYMLVVSYGNQTKDARGKSLHKGLTIYEFAQVCEIAGKTLSENGCQLAFNLDGGNSTCMNFKALDAKTNKMKYMKVNCPEIERFLSDIIYFATLVK